MAISKYVEDLEEVPANAAAPAASATAPAPAPTSPAPSQETGPTLPPPAPQKSTATASAPVAEVDEDPPAGAAKAAHAVGGFSLDNYKVEFGNEKLMSQSDGLDLIRPDQGKTSRFALLTDYLPVLFICNHYIQGKGSFHCLSPEDKSEVCCTTEGQKESQPQFVALALNYTNADPKTGRYAKVDGVYPPIQWSLGFVRMSRSAYKRISQLPEEESRPADIDIAMSHHGKGKGYDYTKASAARWKRNPELVKEVEAAIKPFLDGRKLFGKLGRKVTKLEYRAMLAGTGTAAPSGEVDLSEIDDL